MEPSCCDSGYSESEGVPQPKKTRKSAGAANYRTKFNHAWTKEFPFITSVQKDMYR